ncbi:uncharacterized protein CIMG_06261 [Coccidioides immitis RS]|uniref:Myb-like DNA-binding domain-containing protein n=2 Tax=Coccidioides immitis TaxID=5501 RepID=A0A0E1RXD5_COCIM|nr:uncharacterized protein CIMG_06261 [Coccidioides immitis RS]EAS30782.1 hypothetical protein CIMG_06261 [Coccidioides immitis RS]KMP03363.1 hypothetical protein CIRG_03055 [Coccidioides immitis RMSCC 2394]
MTTLKRSKTLPADGQTTKFLYTILKQLDLKSVDWNLVASQLDISNGHAARMRFSRFRQHMEGITSTPRTPRAKKPKTEKAKSKKQQTLDDLKVWPEPPVIKPEPFIKPEPVNISQIDPCLLAIPRASGPIQAQPFPTVTPADLVRPYPPSEIPVGYRRPPVGENWPQIKMEPCDQEVVMTDVLVKIEPEN